jgi:hypothetical protein
MLDAIRRWFRCGIAYLGGGQTEKKETNKKYHIGYIVMQLRSKIC